MNIRKIAGLAIAVSFALGACSNSASDAGTQSATTSTQSATAPATQNSQSAQTKMPEETAAATTGGKASIDEFEAAMMDVAKAALAKQPQGNQELSEGLLKIFVKCIASKSYDALSADLVNRAVSGNVLPTASPEDQEALKAAFAQCKPAGAGTGK
ncbi:hypothetical protein [Trueperella pecoris]|uniref:Lipoprotein n=1 Tax=Trueperella pecoris TaxID=2733571 RepID=A0A7M1QTM2_9ACTO|nr:hypothetical protein [Trueperella pecoris]QOQ38251.1 hypothetical protein HLG82_01535 [Trueperella pecoris]QOR45258.1 hypothetical protein INS88_08230 [Trueperella pecoris]